MTVDTMSLASSIAAAAIGIAAGTAAYLARDGQSNRCSMGSIVGAAGLLKAVGFLVAMVLILTASGVVVV